MTTFNTGNPIGSTDPRDLYDNAQNFDEAVNSGSFTFVDRRGQTRLTLKGYENAAGSGDVSVQAAADALTQADRAETAAEVAQSIDGIFPNTALGLSATVHNEYFYVVVSHPNSLALYRNDNGTAVDTGKRIRNADALVPRSLLEDDYQYVSYIESGTLNDSNWKAGSYLVGTNVGNRPYDMSGGFALMDVIRAGTYSIQTIRRYSGPDEIFQRIIRFGNSEFNDWVYLGPTEGGGGDSGPVVVGRQELTDKFLYNAFLSSGDLNSDLNDGTYLIGTNVANRPSAMRGGNAILSVENAGNWATQRIFRIGAPDERFVREVRANTDEFGPWRAEGVRGGGNGNRLVGKRVAVLGDSIPAGYGVLSRLRINTGAEILNFAIGGTRMGVHTVAGYSELSGYKIAQSIGSGDWTDPLAGANTINNQSAIDKMAEASQLDWSTVDYIMVGFGTNDFGGDRAVGQLGDSDETTFSGATDIVIREILTAHPHIRLFFWSPFWRRRTPTDPNGIAGGSDVSPNSNGWFLMEYVDALLEVCKSYKVEAVDLYNTSGIGELTHLEYLADELHPTDSGAQLLADKLAGAMQARF